ncbi:MAG: protein-L-isoaspartate(D-aspartate) O-methyltransferase [Proteobacteria bacterium]|nr:protein-L-isoaspartate(D-aspartate) O-methyltransferase [Pseudomonadota bacterium]
MVAQQLGGISDGRVLAAMAEVPRHRFVPQILRERAYDDAPLPIDERQTISQPWIVARMSELLELTGAEKVLEIGTGSGYQAAILSRLCKRVISVERHGALAAKARKKLEKLGIRNVTVLAGDGTLGRSEHAPYDAIIVTAGAPEVPRPLVSQLAPGAHLVVPVGSMETQKLLRITAPPTPDGEPTTETFTGCRFVPLLGRFGWKD